jgi:hypothetical protein
MVKIRGMSNAQPPFTKLCNNGNISLVTVVDKGFNYHTTASTFPGCCSGVNRRERALAREIFCYNWNPAKNFSGSYRFRPHAVGPGRAGTDWADPEPDWYRTRRQVPEPGSREILLLSPLQSSEMGSFSFFSL